MSMSTNKIRRMLRDEFPGAELSMTGGNHIRMRLPDGLIVTVAASPSKTYFMHHVRSFVRKLRQQQKDKTHGKPAA